MVTFRINYAQQSDKKNEHFHIKIVLQKAEATGEGHYYKHRNNIGCRSCVFEYCREEQSAALCTRQLSLGLGTGSEAHAEEG